MPAMTVLGQAEAESLLLSPALLCGWKHVTEQSLFVPQGLQSQQAGIGCQSQESNPDTLMWLIRLLTARTDICPSSVVLGDCSLLLLRDSTISENWPPQ